MLYDNYKSKILIIAKVWETIKRFRILILSCLLAVTATVTGLLIAKGAIYGDKDCPAEITYGETLDYGAGAFMGDITYEYCAIGTDSLYRGVCRKRIARAVKHSDKSEQGGCTARIRHLKCLFTLRFGKECSVRSLVLLKEDKVAHYLRHKSEMCFQILSVFGKFIYGAYSVGLLSSGKHHASYSLKRRFPSLHKVGRSLRIAKLGAFADASTGCGCAFVDDSVVTVLRQKLGMASEV